MRTQKYFKKQMQQFLGVSALAVAVVSGITISNSFDQKYLMQAEVIKQKAAQFKYVGNQKDKKAKKDQRNKDK